MNSRVSLIFLLPVLLSGCAQTLPNTKPFVDASIALSKASDNGYHALNEVYSTIIDLENNCDNRDVAAPAGSYRERLGELEAVEAAHLIVIKALSKYAVSLDQIVQSAGQEIEKSQRIHNAFDTTLKSLKDNSGLAGPYAPTVAAAADVGRTVNGIAGAVQEDAIRAQALQSLSKVLNSTGTDIIKMSAKMKKDLDGLVQMMPNTPPVYVSLYRECHEEDFKYWRSMNATRKAVIRNVLENGLSGEGQNLSWSYSKITQERGFGSRNDAVTLQRINEDMAREAVHLNALKTEEQENLRKFSAVAQLLKVSSETIDELGKAHKNLGLQIEAGTQVDFTALAGYAVRLTELANSVNELSKKAGG